MANPKIIATSYFPSGGELVVEGGGSADYAVPLDNCSELKIMGTVANGASIYWQDPNNDFYKGVQLNEWQGTKLVKKENSAPEDENDGELLIDSRTRDYYKASPFIDKDLTEGTPYYYKLFPYTNQIATNDPGNVLTFNVELTVTFVNTASGSEQIVDTQTTGYGESVTFGGTTPTKAADNIATYSFIGWSLEDNNEPVANILDKITDSIKVYACFQATYIEYDEIFQNINGAEVWRTQVHFGDTPVYSGPAVTHPSMPGKATHSGWSPALAPHNVPGPITHTATYTYSGLSETITDTWAEIKANIKAGTHKTKYPIGATKIVDFGTEYAIEYAVIYQDGETLAGNVTGKKSLTFFPKRHLLKTTLPYWNSNNDNTGGFNSSYFKTYITSTIVPKLPADLRAVISDSVRYYNSYSPSNKNQAVTMTLWPMSHRNMNFDSNSQNSSYETQGPVYSSWFKDNNSRILRVQGTEAAGWWWLGSAIYTLSTRADIVWSEGHWSGIYCSYTGGGVALGFVVAED